ncbi:hypothetical protein PJ985_16720 [Streptomyces sp. ACA25]|uniref:hypothetical protein n=1 Tax=Streptomyces sp. ACA25 TaxID=3022596 RepID=UPI0023080155|nr:hypothetical protein [Streptomyces sp. ACA25]MDB1089207.1 hypothetical protein [Streptomyces sp. ACA25]
MAGTAIPRTVRPAGEDPLARAVWRLRSRACWEDAAALLAPSAEQDAGAALQRAELLIEHCLFTSAGWNRAEEALRSAESLSLSDVERGAAACARGYLAYASTRLEVRDRTDEARAALGRAAALLGPGEPGRARLDFRRGLMAQHLSGTPQAAEAAYRRAHAEAAAGGDLLLCSATWQQLGTLALLAGDAAAAREAFSESLRLREETGFLVGIAPALMALAEVQPEEEAGRLRTEAGRLFRLLGEVPRWMAVQLA